MLNKGVRKTRRRGLAARLTVAFASLAGVLLLIVGLVLTLVSYQAQSALIRRQQQKIASEAAVLTAAHLERARLALEVYGRTSSIQGLLLRSLQIQRQELRAMLNRHGGVLEDLILVDARGMELAHVTPDYIFSVEEMGSQADSPAFQTAIRGEVYVGDEVQHPPKAGFPVVLIAVPIAQQEVNGVLIGGLNMKALWDAIAQVEVGQSGYAYIVRSQDGKIVAHSDYSRYVTLQEQTLERVPIVRRIMQGAPAGETEIEARYQGLGGERVVGASYPLPGTDWVMVVELPTREALAGVRQMLWLLGILTVAGATAAAGLGVLMPRRIVRPLLALQEGAQRLGAGQLDHVIDLPTGDEIQDLAESFNQMAANLRASYAELEQWAHELEDKVEARTLELAQASERTHRRATQLHASAEVARAIASLRDLDELLPEVARLISARFGWYHVGIFLVDKNAQYAVLHAASSPGGQRMLARGHRLRVGSEGIVGLVTAIGEPRIALDVGQDAVYFDNPDLPDTRSEMALPLKVGGQIIGALDVQSTEAAAYDDEDVALLSMLADQVAIAIQNALHFQQMQEALDEVQRVQRQFVLREWTGVLAREPDLGYEYVRRGLPPLADPWPPEARMVLERGELVAFSDGSGGDGNHGSAAAPVQAALAAPIKLRDQVIGVLDLQVHDRPRQWTEDDIALVEAISDQVGLALENARLLDAEQRQRMAAEALREAAVILSSTLAFDELIQRILDQASRVISGDACNLMLVEGDLARVVNHMGYERFGAQDLLDGMQISIESLFTLRQMRETGRPLLIPDTASHPGWTPMPELTWLRSYIGAPIIARGQLVGLLNMDSATPGFFSEDHARQLEAFAAQAAIALENTRLIEETSRRAEQLATLHRIGLTITSALDLHGVLDALYERISQVIDVDSFYVALYDEGSGVVEFPLMVENGLEVEVKPRNIREEPGITGYIIQTRQPLHVPDLAAMADDAPYRSIFIGQQDTRSFLGVPLVFRGEIFGVLSVQSCQPDAYSPADVDLLATIATQASIAIQNARAYERLRETADELREVDRLKTQFLANMSHELRTPLNSIIGFSRVMLKGIDGPLTDLQEADLTSIYNSGQHLLGLINSILDMSKIEAGKIDLSFAEVNLADIFKTALSTTRALIKDRPIELFSEIPDDLPTVWADEQRVRQVLFNLLSNASKFTSEGRITLRAVGGDEFVTISVADTGIGIAPEAQSRLFIPFQQVDGSTTRRAEGTGLGLAISRSFVEMQGGKIWVESEPGKGSTFFFTLPTYRTVQKLEEQEAGIRLEPGKKAVLAVDDDAGVISLLKRYLENDGYQVIGVMQSPHALETARRLAPHLSAITLDVVMPNLDGWQVLRSLKQDDKTKNIPVIVCSIVEGVDQGLGLGAAACLRKPVTRDEMLETLRKLERAV